MKSYSDLHTSFFWVTSLTILTNLLIQVSCQSILQVVSSPDYQLDSPSINLPLRVSEPTCATIWSLSQTACYLNLDQNDRFNSTTMFTPCTVDLKPECRLIMVDDHKKDIAVIQGGISYIGSIWTRPLAYACCECRGCYGAIVPTDPNTCALIYEHEYCSTCLGNVARIFNGESVPVMNQSWNNTISSIIVKPGCFLHVFSDFYFKGNDWIVTQINENLGESWNDQISSYQCKCGSWPEEPSTTSPTTTTPKPVKPTTPVPVTLPSTPKTTTTTTTTKMTTERTTPPTTRTTTVKLTTQTEKETTEPQTETTTVSFIPTTLTTTESQESTTVLTTTTEAPVEEDTTTLGTTPQETSTVLLSSSTTEPSSSTNSETTVTTIEGTTRDFIYY